MADDPLDLWKKTFAQLGEFNRQMFSQGMKTAAQGSEQLARAMGSNVYLMERALEDGLKPTMRSMLELEKDIGNALIAGISGHRDVDEVVAELGERFRAGGRYGVLVDTMGKELFGTATFPREKVLATSDFVTLSYLPPRRGVKPPFEGALFHVGGFLPYSDRIFRFLPEANLFAPFLERGIPVYALELNGEREELPELSGFTLEGFIDTIDDMTEVAFKHSRGKRLALEGYCGLGMQAMAYVAARPMDAARKVKVAFTMVAPVDGRECKLVGGLMEHTPHNLIMSQLNLLELTGGYLPGDALRMGMDIPIGANFPKTPLGRFLAGWKNRTYADVADLDELDPRQRKDLAGAYWISPDNCSRFPLPVDLVRFSSALFMDGIRDDLSIPFSYRGEQISFRSIVEQTDIQLAGFWGGKDLVVPSSTGDVLARNLPDRYTHVVHPGAGHISYVLSRSIWDPKHMNALDPNPIDLISELYAR